MVKIKTPASRKDMNIKMKMLSIGFLVLVACSKPDAPTPAPAPAPHVSAMDQIPVTMAAHDLCDGQLNKFLQEGEKVGLLYGPPGKGMAVWVNRRTLQSIFDACGRHDLLPTPDSKNEWVMP